MELYELDKMEVKELVAGFKARMVHSPQMTLAFWEIKAGANLPEHSHPHEQVTVALEGQLELTVDGESRTLAPGSVVVIAPHAVHSGKCISDARVLDVFHPVREDYR